MYMTEVKNSYEAYGFVKDCSKELFGKIISNKKLKEIHIETYTNKPYMLFGRIIEKNVTMLQETNRIVIRMSDKYKTILVNLILDEIKDCFFKQYMDNQYEIVFNIHNLHYKILIII